MNKKVEEKGCVSWKNEDIVISDHFLIAIACGKAKMRRKKIKKGKWRIQEANWEKYATKVNERTQEEISERLVSVDTWENEIKEVLKQEAVNEIGTKKIKVGPLRLKGWWDKEVEIAITSKKKGNRIQRRLNKKVKKQGNEYQQEWQNAWEGYNKPAAGQSLIINRIY